MVLNRRMIPPERYAQGVWGKPIDIWTVGATVSNDRTKAPCGEGGHLSCLRSFLILRWHIV